MPHLLTLRGRHALSPFRVAKLEAALAAGRPEHAVTGISATCWHFVEVERELTSAERRTLDRLPLGQTLYEPGVKLRYVYFPTTSIISLLYFMEDGASAEIAIVGNEGMLGISLFMGGDTTPSNAVVQSAGHGFRLKAQLPKDAFGRFGPTMNLLLRYTQALITQMAQTAVCNRHHLVDQQLCRWLLLSLDRLGSNELTMTQELIANMLGVRREGVTEGVFWRRRGDCAGAPAARPASFVRRADSGPPCALPRRPAPR